MDTSPHTASQVLRRVDLHALGMRAHEIRRAVAAGELVRVRRDRYMVGGGGPVERAVRVGGRLACVSVLALAGVFVLDPRRVHVHLARSASRLRSPHDAARSLASADRAGLCLHWSPLREPPEGLAAVGLHDALRQAVRCQEPRAAVATVDSVLHAGLMTWDEVRDVFSGLPRRYRTILRLADPTAEAGSETFMRLILRQLGLRYETQVVISGVGRVDFLVEGWLIIECDSKAHHEGWEKQRRDRKRDLAAAQLGLVTFRPLAEDLFFAGGDVAAAVRGIVAAHRRCR